MWARIEYSGAENVALTSEELEREVMEVYDFLTDMLYDLYGDDATQVDKKTCIDYIIKQKQDYDRIFGKGQ